MTWWSRAQKDKPPEPEINPIATTQGGGSEGGTSSSVLTPSEVTANYLNHLLASTVCTGPYEQLNQCHNSTENMYLAPALKRKKCANVFSAYERCKNENAGKVVEWCLNSENVACMVKSKAHAKCMDKFRVMNEIYPGDPLTKKQTKALETYCKREYQEALLRGAEYLVKQLRNQDAVKSAFKGGGSSASGYQGAQV